MTKSTITVRAGLIALLIGICSTARATISVVGLACEHLTDPLGVDVEHPTLSWQLQSDQRGEDESAYQVIVASSPQILASGRGDRWDSRKMLAHGDISTAYAGATLQSGVTVYWKMRAWGAGDEPSAWSDPARWTSGLMHPIEWTAQWISPVADAAATQPVVHPMPIFRRSFTVSKPVKRAIAFVCGLGQFELRFNGEKISDHVLDPGWTNYKKTCLYVTFDITDRLKVGENAIGVLLGNGMYNLPKQKERYQKFSGSFGAPKLIAQVQIDFADGTTQILSSDATWKTIDGPITYSNEYGGEDFDARLWPDKWDMPGFDDSKWSGASVVNAPGGELAGISRSAPPIRVAHTFIADDFTQPKPGTYVYDLTQNAAFLPQITVSGERGAAVQIAPGELLHADGTVSQDATGKPVWFTYTLNGSGQETWTSRFTYIGCRYLQVTGAVPKGTPNPSNLPVIHEAAGRFISSTSAAVGDFQCSSELFNRTADLIRWAMRSNMQSILTDCPQRERLGWLEQDHLVGPSMMDAFDVESLMDKICWDMSDAQTADGLVPDIAPEYTRFANGFRDSPEWGSACVLIPWQLYQRYGDLNVLKDHYDMIVRYVHYLGTKANDNILSFGLGDWYDIGPKHPGMAQLTPKALTATAFYYRDLSLLGQIATLINRPDDAQHDVVLAGQVCDSFNRQFYNPQQHIYATGSQTALALPLVFDMVPRADRAAVGQQLVAEIKAHGDRLTSGDIGYRYLLRALADIGRSDLIYDMNSRSDRPGYAYILAKGATSLTEGWDGSASQDHFMLGHIMEWFYSDLAGIAGDHAFEHLDIHPTPVRDISWAKASYRSVRGMVTSSWKNDISGFTLDVTIPPGSIADVYLPGDRLDQTTESGKPLLQTTGVSDAAIDASSVYCKIVSGTYHFHTRLREDATQPQNRQARN